MQWTQELPVATAEQPLRQTRRSIAGLLLALVMTASLPLDSKPAHAQPYPERSIKIVVPFSAGGPTDVVARLVARSLSGRLGQNVIVENMAGAGGRLGAKAVATARPDGYTLLLGGTNINAIIGSLYKDLGFDPIDSFAPIGAVCVDSMALAINPRVPASSFKQFVQYARDNPGKLKFGAPPGIYTQFAAEFFKVKTGTDILFVPYKGGAPAITDLLGGHIDMVFNPKSSLLTHFQEGKLKALAVTSESRWPELPDTPTMREVGVSGFPTEVWFGLLAPLGTPSSTVEMLNRAVNDAGRSLEVRTTLAKLGVEGKNGTPQDFAVALAEQARTWKTVVDATGVKGE
jgi:tripartite-type tricarboxylate transporter receptor subunit TctC